MNADWQPVQGSNPPAGVDTNAHAAAGGNWEAQPDFAAAGGDWRAQLMPGGRSRIVNKIMETLMKHLPASAVPEGLNELQKIAVRFEEKIYAAATSQPDYLRKISLKMIYMETRTQQAPGYAQVIPIQNNPAQVIEPGAVTVMDDLDDHVDGTNQRLQARVQKRFAVLNKRAKGGCSCMSLLLSFVAIVIFVVIVWLS